jgi:uncharacterized protein YbcC (UPF0753/DUF2309 family)
MKTLEELKKEMDTARAAREDTRTAARTASRATDAAWAAYDAARAAYDAARAAVEWGTWRAAYVVARDAFNKKLGEITDEDT